MARKSGGILAAIGEGLSLGGKKYEEYLERKKKEEKAETLKDSIREIIGYKTGGSIDPQNLKAGVTADDPVSLIAGMVDTETGDLSNFGKLMLKAEIANRQQERFYQYEADKYAREYQPDYSQLLDVGTKENPSKNQFKNFEALYGVKLSEQAQRQIIMDLIEGKNPLKHTPVYIGKTGGLGDDTARRIPVIGGMFKNWEGFGARETYDLK